MTRTSYQSPPAPELWIAGIGTQYPEHRICPEDLEALAARHCDGESEG